MGSAGSQQALGNWGVWSSPLEKEANGCAEQFYSVGNPSGQGPSPLALPMAGEVIIKAVGVPELAASCHRVQLLPVVLADLIVAVELL